MRLARLGKNLQRRTQVNVFGRSADQSAIGLSYVAAQVLTAIREDEFYVFIHPEMRADLEERSTGIRAAMDRAAVR